MLALTFVQLTTAHAELPLEADRWLPVQQLGTPITDPRDEALDGQLDLVGDAEHPAGQWWLSDEYLYLRMRLATSPVHPTISGALADEGGWGLLVDTDAEPSDFEHFVIVDDSGRRLTIGPATTESEPSWSSPPGEPLDYWYVGGPVTFMTATDAESTLGGEPNGFLDLAIPRDHIGLDSAEDNIRIAMATDSFRLSRGFEYDLAGGGAEPSLAEAWSDPIGEDPDEDGLDLMTERLIGTDSQRTDSDGDGHSDGDEHLIYGTDPLDPLDPDPSIDFDCDGTPDEIAGVSVDMGLDPDEDGLSTAEELECESDPCVADADVDGDGIPNLDEADCGGDPCVAETDVDGDGISTTDELLAGTDPCSPTTTDADTGSPTDTGDSDTGEEESDGQSAEDNTLDEDCDGVLDFEDDTVTFDDDADNDGDGISNGQEIDVCLTDPCVYDIDPDRDGIQNDREAMCGTDPCNPDSDSDGRWDNQEMGNEDCGPDTDGDGVVDALDPQATKASDPLLPETGNHGFDGGNFTGGGCGHSPSVPVSSWLFLACIVLLSRRSGRVLALLLLIPIVQDAQAQTVNSNRFMPSPASKSFVILDDPTRTESGFVSHFLVHYAKNPLLYRYEDASTPPIRVVGELWTTDISFGYRQGALDFSMRLPVHPHVMGDDGSHWGSIGDTTASARYRVLDRTPDSMGLAVSGHIFAPTGNRTQWLSDGRLSGAAMAHVSTGTTIVLASHLGFQFGASQNLETLNTRPQIQWGLGTHIPVTNSWSSSMELTSAHHLASLTELGAHPMEILAAGHCAINTHWQITAGAATGVSRGIGTPAYRLLLGLQYGPANRSAETRTTAMPPQTTTLSLSITDNEDRPVQAEAILVEIAETASTNEDGQASIELPEGTHTLRITQPGFVPIQRVVEIRSGERAQLAIVLAPQREQPNTKELLAHDRVHFAPGSAAIQESETAILDEVAMVILDHDDLLLIEVQGHSGRGAHDAESQELSEQRADAVVEYLIAAGVNQDRLRAKGYGASLPLSSAKIGEDMAKNRRVQFYVLERSVP